MSKLGRLRDMFEFRGGDTFRNIALAWGLFFIGIPIVLAVLVLVWMALGHGMGWILVTGIEEIGSPFVLCLVAPGLFIGIGLVVWCYIYHWRKNKRKDK